MTDLVREVAAQTRPPEFDTLLRRASRRRARRRASAIVAAAGAVAACAITVAVLQPSQSRSQPTRPASTTTIGSTASRSGSATATVHSGLAVDHESIARAGHLVGFAADGHGGLLTGWQSCHQGCQYVYHVLGGGNSGWSGTDQEVYAAADPGFVELSMDHPDGSLDRDGAVLHISAASSGSIGPDTAVLPSKSGLTAVDPGSLTMWSLPPTCLRDQVGWADATSSSNGTIFAFPVTNATTGGYVPLCSSTDGVTWHTAIANLDPDPAAGPGQVVATGDHVAALSAGDDGMPADPFWVSTDGGAHFSRLTGAPFDRVESMATTSDGVLFVADMAGKVYCSTDWSTFTIVAGAPTLWSLEPDGAGVVGQGGDVTDPKIFTISSAAAITPWPQPLR